jgi:hypothetical protein
LQKLPLEVNYEILKKLSFEDLKSLSQTDKELLSLVKRILKDEKYLSSELTRRLKEKDFDLPKNFLLDLFSKNVDSEIRYRKCEDGTDCQIEMMIYQGQQMIEKFNISFHRPTRDEYYDTRIQRLYSLDYLNLYNDDLYSQHYGPIDSNTLQLLRIFIKLYQEKKSKP